MHAQLFLDPRIRDYVFVPLVFLMLTLQTLRITAMRWMNEPKNKLVEKANLSYNALFGTLFEKDADKERRLPEEQMDIIKMIEDSADVDRRET
jgi:ER membrane protein complex subunit 3